MTSSSNTNIETRVGFGPIKAKQGIYEESATQKADLGTRILVGDRVFRYAEAGATALIAGTLVTPTKMVTGTIELNKSVAATAAVGSYTCTITTAAANTWLAEGHMVVNDEAGEGRCYRIKSSKANATTATSTDLVLYDPIATALTTSSQVELYPSLYSSLLLVANVKDHISGIPPIAVTAEYYFWLQTWGPCAALVGATVGIGDMVAPHTTDGSIMPAAAYTSNIVGFSMTAGTATEYNGIYLRIAP